MKHPSSARGVGSDRSGFYVYGWEATGIGGWMAVACV